MKKTQSNLFNTYSIFTYLYISKKILLNDNHSVAQHKLIMLMIHRPKNVLKLLNDFNNMKSKISGTNWSLVR